MVFVLWGLCCGSCVMGLVLWGLCYGACVVGFVLWGLCYGLVLWGLCYGAAAVGEGREVGAESSAREYRVQYCHMC